MLAAYLLEPARRSYELAELAADAGIGVAEAAREAEEPTAKSGSSPSARRRRTASSRPRRRASSPSWRDGSARG